MTVADSTADEYYGSDKDYVFAIAEALIEEARALDALGVSVIQFDEPVYSRQPDRAVELGIPALDRAAQGLKNAKAAVHVCYGYPHKGIQRERKESYPTIIAALEKSSIDILSLEFEVSKMDPKVLRLCPSKTVMFGCIDVGHDENAGRIETPEHVCGKLLAAAEHLPATQIMAAPDCGLVKIDVPTARAKLQAMCAGARLARQTLELASQLAIDRARTAAADENEGDVPQSSGYRSSVVRIAVGQVHLEHRHGHQDDDAERGRPRQEAMARHKPPKNSVPPTSTAKSRPGSSPSLPR
jgi:5-methyltetrahydropteroyltriglutamate--homocysteine methyltransferase